MFGPAQSGVGCHHGKSVLAGQFQEFMIGNQVGDVEFPQAVLTGTEKLAQAA